MLSPQFAFSTVEADRVSTFESNQDPNGLLGIVDNSPNIGTVDKDSQEVYYLDDNTGGTWSATDITATITSYANCNSGGTADCPSVDVGVTAASHDFSLVVSCSGTDIKATDTMTLDITATGDPTVVANRTTSASVETKCRGNTGGGSTFNWVNASNVTAGGTQTFEFDLNTTLKNGDTVTIDLSDATGVDYSRPAKVTSVSGNDKAQFLDSDTLQFTSQGSTSGTVSITVDGYQVTGSTGDSYTAYFSKGGDTKTDDFQIV